MCCGLFARFCDLDLGWASGQADGTLSNQRVTSAALATIALFSIPMDQTTSVIVGMPEELTPPALLRLVNDPLVIVSDAETFSIEGSRYMAVAQQCRGAGCHLTKVGVFCWCG